MKQQTILNSEGKPVLLNAEETRKAGIMQKMSNALGYEINITTLTTVLKKVSEQQFFEIAPADYIPIKVGEGAWSSQLLTFQSFALADDFATGVINTGGNNSRLASADAGVQSVTNKVINWAKTIGWNVFDVELATKSGNWDIVTAKEKSRKKNWDLGIQNVAFNGLKGDSSVYGLYNLPGVVVNGTTAVGGSGNNIIISQQIGSMTPTQLSTFMSGLIAAYRANSNRTVWPNRLIVPESDYLAMVAPSSPTYPMISMLSLLEQAFATATKSSDFKILPAAYGDNTVSGAGYQQYVLYRYDEESLRMDIPVDYTSTLANSVDNFNFQNVAYGQFTGVIPYRPLEIMYFRY